MFLGFQLFQKVGCLIAQFFFCVKKCAMQGIYDWFAPIPVVLLSMARITPAGVFLNY